MGLFSKIRAKFNNDTRLSTGIYGIAGLPTGISTSSSGKYVTPTTAMQMTAVNACVRVLSESVAQLPLNTYKLEPDGNKTKDYEHPLYFLLHDEPNPEMTSFVFRETLMAHLLLWGNAYAQIIRDGMGRVTALYPLIPDRMTVKRNDSGQIYYEYNYTSDDAMQHSFKTIQLPPRQVLHIPGMGFDGLVGMSPISYARNAIGMAMAAEESGAKFYSNGSQVSGVLEVPTVLSDDAYKRLKESWNAKYNGSNNAGKTAILEQGTKFTQMTVNPADAQFLETRKFQIDEIARIYRIPPHMIGDLEHATFSNIEHSALEYVKYTLEPWLIRWEQALSRCLLSPKEKQDGVFFKFNVDGLMRGDYQSRMQGYATGIQNGFMSPNDVRELENMDRIPDELGGDKYYVNGNMMPLDMAGAAYRNNGGGVNE